MSEDLMFQDEIRAAVREVYSSIPQGGGARVVRRFYSDEEIAMLPEGAVNWALGVGNPVRYAELMPGETVLDVGSGGGIDSILAAHKVGPEGRVIGLDMLDEMCARAGDNAADAGVADRAEFREGLMEDVPLPDESVDVIISNGVINLSARKSRTLAELARVLRPGGRLCVVDLTVDDDLPAAVLGSTAAWAGCISGALTQSVMLRKLDHVGFVDATISDPAPFGLTDAGLYPLFTPDLIDLMRDVLPAERHENVATSVLVRARKPA